MLVFFDDILVYSTSYEEHLQHLHKVLSLLAKEQWVVKLKKCQFAKQEIHYLGHILSGKGVQTDPSKVTAVSQWPTPTVRELRRFLGLAGFYRKFVRNFAIIAKPLTNLLKKQVLHVLTQDHQVAFDTFKHALCSAPVLGIPDFAKPFAIETDACQTGVGAVLLQNGHPLAYVSKPLGVKNQGCQLMKRNTLLFWWLWISGVPTLAEFIIYTDQKVLIHLNDQRLHTFWHMRVFNKLLGLHYRIVYKKGSDNSAVDSLSQRVHDLDSCAAMSVVIPAWCDEIVNGYQQDKQSLSMLTKLAARGDSVPHFTLNQGLLK